MGRYCTEKGEAGSFDLESFEMSIRSAMHRIGRGMLGMLINADGGGYQGRTIPCGKAHQYEFIEYRDKELLTVLGPVTVTRAYYYDQQCQSGWCPKDSVLDIEGTSYSSGVRRMMSKVGAYRPFGLGHEDLYEMADIRVSAKEVERISQMVGSQVEAFHAAEAKASLSDKIVSIRPSPRMYMCMDGTGVPVVKKETAGRQGKGKDGQAKTREVKLGCVFTQIGFDQKGYPVRDDASTSYTGAIEPAEVFGQRLKQSGMHWTVRGANSIIALRCNILSNRWEDSWEHRAAL